MDIVIIPGYPSPNFQVLGGVEVTNLEGLSAVQACFEACTVADFGRIDTFLARGLNILEVCLAFPGTALPAASEGCWRSDAILGEVDEVIAEDARTVVDRHVSYIPGSRAAVIAEAVKGPTFDFAKSCMGSPSGLVHLKIATCLGIFQASALAASWFEAFS